MNDRVKQNGYSRKHVQKVYKELRERYGSKCYGCGIEYKLPHSIQFHHFYYPNGRRLNTLYYLRKDIETDPNCVILLCSTCHKAVGKMMKPDVKTRLLELVARTQPLPPLKPVRMTEE